MASRVVETNLNHWRPFSLRIAIAVLLCFVAFVDCLFSEQHRITSHFRSIIFQQRRIEQNKNQYKNKKNTSTNNNSNGISDSSLVKWLRKNRGANAKSNDVGDWGNEEEFEPLFSSSDRRNTNTITAATASYDKNTASMSNKRGQRPPKGGIPPELMNVEFNSNDPQGDDDANMNIVANGTNINSTNNDMMMNNGYSGYNYAQQQRTYTYKDRPGSLRGDGYGGGGSNRYNPVTNPSTLAVQSHNYEPDESEVWRAYVAQVHYSNRGQWWTTGKKRSLKRWILTFAVGVVQALVATVCNFASRSMATTKFEYVYDLLNPSMESYSEEQLQQANDDDLAADAAGGDDSLGGSAGGVGGSSGADSSGADIWTAFWTFVLIQTLMCAAASIFVYIGEFRCSCCARARIEGFVFSMPRNGTILVNIGANT